MATTTTADISLSTLPPATGSAGLRGVIASEFTKLRSVRSTYWTLASLIVVSVGVATLVGFGTANHLQNNPWDKAGQDVTLKLLFAFFELGQLIIAVLGVMVVTTEYSTGMIRTSLTAMPRRGTMYLGKLIAITSVTLVVSLVTSFISFFVGQAILSGSGVAPSLFHSVSIPASVIVNGNPNKPGPPSYTFQGTDVISSGTVLTAVIGTALFVTLVALISFGLGAIIRHTAGGITSTIGLMLVLPIIFQLLPDNWGQDIMRFFPDGAGRVISVTVNHGDNTNLWSAWPQMLVTVVWAAVLVGLGAYLFRKRDA